jgi:hypothetical protein
MKAILKFLKNLVAPKSWQDLPESERSSIMSRNLSKRKELALARANSGVTPRGLSSRDIGGAGGDGGADVGTAVSSILAEERRLNRQNAARQGERSGK